MKYINIFVISLLFISCAPHKVLTQTGEYKVQTIDSVPGTKSELFVKANEWVAKRFNSAKDVIQMHDKEAGKLIVKAEMESYQTPLIAGVNYYVNYTLSIDVKDNKCKMLFSDFILDYEQGTSSKSTPHTYNKPFEQGAGSWSVPAGTWDKVRADCLAKANALAKDFRNAMRKNSENW